MTKPAKTPALSEKGKRRLKKLKVLLAKLNAGQHVQNRDLQTWLTADEYEQMEKDWQEQKTEFRNIEKPAELNEYELRLKKALLLYSRADYLSRKGKSAGAKELFNQADTAFERTIECLQELLQLDPGKEIWFDRALDFSAGSHIGIDPESIPRIVTSRSRERQGSGILNAQQSKREIKVSVVETAIAELKLGDLNKGQREKENAALLKAKLTALKQR